jgi:hypothetical protein
MTYLRLLLLAWAAFLMFVGPARAETTTERALRALCGPNAVYLAPHVQEAARTHLLHPVTLVATISNESHCDAAAVNPRSGAMGLGQIMPGLSADQPGRYLLDPRDNLYLTARHLAKLLMLCGSLAGAVHVYHGYKRCSGWRRDWYAKRVAADERRFWKIAAAARRGGKS